MRGLVTKSKGEHSIVMYLSLDCFSTMSQPADIQHPLKCLSYSPWI